MSLINCIIVLLVSMVPIIELRGAIPIGVGLGVPELLALAIAVVGNMIPVPFIYKFSRKLLELGSKALLKPADESTGKTPPSRIHRATDKVVIKPINKFCNFCLNKGETAGRKLMKRGGDSVYIALFLFVGIPIPGTGVWTGTLAASLLDLDYKKTVKAIICGVLLAGVIMLAVSLGVFKVIFS